jgi:hypothetical protein
MRVITIQVGGGAMAIVRIGFDGGDVPIVTGDVPPDGQTPITDPIETGFMTNQPFIVVEGLYCFGLRTALSYTPLWQVVQAIEGEEAEIFFQSLR